ncbi:hypothetical protein ACFQ61_23660 [Streptomyces sp. NPDC056500]|uniref:hypothetical protein n=1 Tax=Streptomyces sp. NPDC056500 TaxID=3345840 RepID=UPI003687114F
MRRIKRIPRGDSAVATARICARCSYAPGLLTADQLLRAASEPISAEQWTGHSHQA